MVSQAIAPTNGAAIAPRDTVGLVEKVLIEGDLGKLTPDERIRHYKSVVESLGLNPLTRPFDYLVLNGKMILYANRSCTDQLRKIHGIDLTLTNRERLEDVWIVTASARDRNGRTDESVGAVSIGGLKGDALANALMKAETKAKRRVTLSIVGLGWLDETETETIRDAQSVTVDQATGEIVEASANKRPKSVPASKELKDRYDKICHQAADRFLSFKTPDANWDQAMYLAEGKALSEAISADEKVEMTVEEAQN